MGRVPDSVRVARAPTGGRGLALDINGALPRLVLGKTLQREQRVFNVIDFGADPFGVRDSYPAIQEAIYAASEAVSGIVFHPGGRYLTSATLLVPSFVTLLGVGCNFRATEYSIDPTTLGSMIVGAPATTYDLIKNADATNGNTGIALDGLWLGVGTSTTSDVAVVLFDKVRRSIINNCYFRGAATSNRYGLRYTGASEHCWITHSWLEGCGVKTGTSANSLGVSDCEVAQGGVDFGGGFDHIVKGCDIYQDGIAAGVAYAAYPHGIKMRDVEGCLIFGNHIASAREYGIYLASGCTGNQIQVNNIKNCSQEATQTWSGIGLNSDTAAHPTTNNVVTNNRCYDSATGTQKYGIQVTSDSGTQTNGNLIANNVLSSNALGGFNTTAGLSNTIVGNNGHVTEATGSASKQNGSTITHGLAGTPTSVQVNSSVAKHTVTVTAVGSATFTIGLHDDTGAAIAVNETVYWSATYVPA